MKFVIEQRGRCFYVISAVRYTLMTTPVAKLLRQGFTPARPGCLHWLVFGGRWRCFYSDTDRRAPFPCRLPLRGDWDHPRTWAHSDGRRVLCLEAYGLSSDSLHTLGRFAARYSLALEVQPCLRNDVPPFGVRLESRGGRFRLPRLTHQQRVAMWTHGLWAWEV